MTRLIITFVDTSLIQNVIDKTNTEFGQGFPIYMGLKIKYSFDIISFVVLVVGGFSFVFSN